MSSTKETKDIIDCLYELRLIALRAYWKDRVYCGSDFDSVKCDECEHYLTCQSMQQLKYKLKDLILDSTS